MQTVVLLEESFQAVLDIATFLSISAVILVAIRSTFKAFWLCAIPIYLYSAWYNWTIMSLSFDYSAGIPANSAFYTAVAMAVGMFALPPLIWWGLTRLLGLFLKKEALLYGAASLLLVAAYKGVYFWLALREEKAAASLTGDTVSVFSLALNNCIHGLLLFAAMMIFYTIYSSRKEIPTPSEENNSILSED